MVLLLALTSPAWAASTFIPPVTCGRALPLVCVAGRPGGTTISGSPIGAENLTLQGNSAGTLGAILIPTRTVTLGATAAGLSAGNPQTILNVGFGSASGGEEAELNIRASGDDVAKFVLKNGSTANFLLHADAGTEVVLGTQTAIPMILRTNAVARATFTATGTLDLAALITSYDGDTTTGHGIVSVVGNTLQTGQSAAIGTTTLFTTNTAGLYVIRFYLLTTTAGNTVNVTATFGWTDESGGKTLTSGNLAIQTLGFSQTQTTSFQDVRFRATAGSAITYATAISGALGTGRYLIHAVVTRLA